MFGSLQFLAFLNLQLFLNTSLSICPFPINLEWRKGLCGTEVRLGKRWGWLGMWESVVLCIHMVSDCWIPQLLTHLSLPGKCGIALNVRLWLLAAALGTRCLLSPEWWGCLEFLLFSLFLPFPPSAGHLSHCTVYSTLILELVSCCFHQFLPVFNSGPCVQSSISAEIIQAPGRDFFFCSHFHLVRAYFFTTSHICTVKNILPVRRLSRLDTEIQALEKLFLRASLPKESGNILLSGNAAAVCSDTNKIPLEMGWLFSPNH